MDSDIKYKALSVNLKQEIGLTYLMVDKLQELLDDGWTITNMEACEIGPILVILQK